MTQCRKLNCSYVNMNVFKDTYCLYEKTLVTNRKYLQNHVAAVIMTTQNIFVLIQLVVKTDWPKIKFSFQANLSATLS